jgi:capsular polysaccharide transport system ATP-binding protein
MISFQNATKEYRSPGRIRKRILDDVSLSLPRGRSIGIFGANGAGKSTLVRLIAGVEPLDRGTIKREGAVSFPLGFGGTFHPHLSGRENIRFLARIYGTDERKAIEYVKEFAELGDYFDLPFETYSSGMQSRLAFGACLAIEFDLYLIDEVTAVGDSRFRRKCLEAFEQRAAVSDVLIVSHDEGTIRAWCDSGAVLMNGTLTYFKNLEEAIEQHRRNVMDNLASVSAQEGQRDE